MTAPEGAAPATPRTIDSVLLEMEDVMHSCCDQPLSVDAMTLTRSWRGILENFVASLTSERATTPPTRLESGSCEKCGESEKIACRFRMSGDASYGSLGYYSFAAATVDRLEFHCQRCGYGWWKRALDAALTSENATQ